MKTNEKYLKKIELIVKSRDCLHESFTTVFVDQSIADALIDRGQMTNIDSVEFVNKSTVGDWWHARPTTIDDLVEHLRRENQRTEYVNYLRTEIVDRAEYEKLKTKYGD